MSSNTEDELEFIRQHYAKQKDKEWKSEEDPRFLEIMKVEKHVIHFRPIKKRGFWSRIMFAIDYIFNESEIIMSMRSSAFDYFSRKIGEERRLQQHLEHQRTISKAFYKGFIKHDKTKKTTMKKVVRTQDTEIIDISKIDSDKLYLAKEGSNIGIVSSKSHIKFHLLALDKDFTRGNYYGTVSGFNSVRDLIEFYLIKGWSFYEFNNFPELCKAVAAGLV